MRRFTITLAATALALGSMALTANAQTQAVGAAGVHAQLQNATPIVKQAACNGTNWFLWLWARMGLECLLSPVRSLLVSDALETKRLRPRPPPGGLFLSGTAA